MSKVLTKIFGDPNDKALREINPVVDAVAGLKEKYAALGDEDLRALGPKWKEEVVAGKKTLDELMPECFAAQREISKRKRGGKQHFDVQLVAGAVLHRGTIAEFKTGEGKTSYAAPLAAALNALSGQGVHVVTVNDYLSMRDTGWAGELFWGMGLTVSAIVHDHAYLYDPQHLDPSGDKYTRHLREITRQEAYAADITYGTNNEFGFDYLRDNMVQETGQKVQRPLSYAIVDECDSIFIDEARTPLIISAPAEESADLYFKFAQLVRQLKENEDYNIDEKMRSAVLTEEGIAKMEKWLGMGNIYTEGGISMVHHIEQALKANTLFKRDKDYVVSQGEEGPEVVIIDEFTGRQMEGRRYSEGLHQAIEAKEDVKVQRESKTLATITFQNYFRMYDKLSGMTGTAQTEAEEFAKIYGLEVIAVPTNKPVIRKDNSDFIFKTENAKYAAVAKEVRECQEKGQPILVGTISIERNEFLSELFKKEGIRHNVLNAKAHEREAHIIAEAGKAGSVTLATNMAGRGVDIILGGTPPEEDQFEDKKAFEREMEEWQAQHEKVLDLGGLLVIGTERHESRRIDNQLRGRGGRQGDPGASRFFVSMDDDLMRIFGSERIKSVMTTLKVPEDMPIETKMVSKSIESAQKKVEGNNFDIRKHLVEYDDVMNKHRDTVYKKRNEVLETFETQQKAAEEGHDVPEEMASLSHKVLEMIEAEIEQVVSFHTAEDDEKKWDLKEIYEVAHSIFPVPESMRVELDVLRDFTAGDKAEDAQARTHIIEYLKGIAGDSLDKLEKTMIENSGNPLAFAMLQKSLILNAIDSLWVEHLEAMGYLRTGIGLRGYGQRDPLVEYKKEAYRLFVELMNLIEKQVVTSIYKIADAQALAPGVFGRSAAQMQMAGAQKEMQKGGSSIERSASGAMAREVERRETKISTKPRDEEGNKIGRNDPCHCGSGKKYKKCHGA